ncbi:Scr1 family TA system antitoxin-like transcriptional regulator [Streptomyces scopuliridis]|uniref:Scr1 family TA system antitoxin-like transcriptional regulator n=1 Tax=Streptomyces scopuliridis TaxID=452529 RepID=UPI0036750D49
MRNARFRQWARLETEAVNLHTYERRAIPGLLPRQAYARKLYADRLSGVTLLPGSAPIVFEAISAMGVSASYHSMDVDSATLPSTDT